MRSRRLTVAQPASSTYADDKLHIIHPNAGALDRAAADAKIPEINAAP